MNKISQRKLTLRLLSLLLCAVLGISALAGCGMSDLLDEEDAQYIADELESLISGLADDFEEDDDPQDITVIDTEPPQSEASETIAEDTEPEPVETEPPVTEAPETKAPETEPPVTETPETKAPETEPPVTEAPETKPAIDEDGVYYKKDDVALYIHTYGRLPKNYITKSEAQDLGWPGGGLEKYAPGKCIGGDYFGNYEGLLPKKKGRQYTECDIDTYKKSSRGAKRIIFSNDGLIYYTDDHYESFTLLYGEE